MSCARPMDLPVILSWYTIVYKVSTVYVYNVRACSHIEKKLTKLWGVVKYTLFTNTQHAVKAEPTDKLQMYVKQLQLIMFVPKIQTVTPNTVFLKHTQTPANHKILKLVDINTETYFAQPRLPSLVKLVWHSNPSSGFRPIHPPACRPSFMPASPTLA